MTNIFYRLFVLSQKHKFIFFSALAAVLGVALYFASGIRLEENISSIIPQDEKIARVSKTFEGFKMNERLVMHLYTEDTANPQLLIQIAKQFSDSLQVHYAPYINEIKREFPDTQIEQLYSYYYQHLPFYLEDEDYQKIEARITEEGIQSTLRRNYKSLMSPVSMVTKKMLIRDPFSLTTFPLQRANALRGNDDIQLYQNHLITQDRQHLIFFVTLSNPPNETKNNAAFIEGIEEQTEQFQQENPELHIEYFGQAAVSVANANRIKNDIYITVSIALLLLFIFISLFYRNVSIFFIAVTPGIFGAIVSIALLAIIKSKVSAISLGVGSVMLGITIDYALHFFTHYKHQKNLQALFSDISGPMLMSSVTTACAFFALLFIRSEALADLGLFAGTSVIVSALYTLIVLPHFVVRKGNAEDKVSSSKNIAERLVSKLAQYPFQQSRWAISLFIILSVVSCFTWKNYAFESDMLRLNYMPEKLAAYEKNLNKISTYSANGFYLISTGGDFWDALETGKKVKQKLKQLQQDSLIYNYITVNDIVPPASQQKKKLQAWKAFWKAQQVDTMLTDFYAEAQKLGFQSQAFGQFESMLKQNYSLLQQEDVASILSVFGDDLIIPHADDSVSVVSSVKLSSDHKREVLEEFEQQQDVLIFDKGYFTARLVELLEEDFSKLVNISLLVVFAIILLSYGRIELAIITFMPILLSWLWILGLMGLIGLKFNIVNIIICTFIFGLGIDYSIFVMRGLTQNYKLGLINLLSYKKSIILSALTTLAGIGVLAFAQHPALRSIALLAIIGILSVIFLTFTVQPILYNFLIQKRKEKGVVPYTLLSLFLSVFAFLYFLLGCVLLSVIRIFLLIPVIAQEKKKKLFHWIMMFFCRSLLYIMINLKKDIRNKEQIDFSKPSVIISNHHSFLDIIILLMLHPKVVMVTNEWVYHSPFFGKAVQYADFIPAAEGMEDQLEKIRKLVQHGYSIIIFPEGSRSETSELRRFHKGAFFLAEKLALDVQPVLLHGTHYIMPKKDAFHLKSGRLTVKFLPRIMHTDTSFGITYSERTKSISKHFKAAYQELKNELESPEYFKEVLIKNYLYKGPVLEWYLRVKQRLENGYHIFHELLPISGRIVDLGCGYGFMSYALAFSGENRQILGVDYDTEKIEVAKNCPVKPANLEFDEGDVATYAYGKSDAFIISDVLHYLLPDKQLQVLKNMVMQLNPGGRMIIRDGDSSKADRHKGTQLTEVFSTGTGFNKTQNKLYFISAEMISNFASENSLALEVIDNTRLTSNTIFILTKKDSHGKI
ncbi:MMPL family transporter [Catalinimonas niigatensis]|uniref:MMPL family transporter n=1 Tax=Catalinimonas niigatensis TaxID=1397264 RepID=UPI002666AED3|nr:MMPL family transporter [Catalinimonas niigatensis]WPP48772.1 MMPL family transporter [Catalinimonas niigatensis]